MTADKTIKISKKTKSRLDDCKLNDRETYDDVVSKILDLVDLRKNDIQGIIDEIDTLLMVYCDGVDPNKADEHKFPSINLLIDILKGKKKNDV